MASLNPSLERKDGFGNTLILKESGQMGRYGDSRWSGTVTLEREWNSPIDMVKALVQEVVQEGYIFPIGAEHPFHRPYFTELKQGIGPEAEKTWAFVVHRMYLD